MNKRQQDLIDKVGLSKDNFEPSEDAVTISDLVDAISVLTTIVLGDMEDEE